MRSSMCVRVCVRTVCFRRFRVVAQRSHLLGPLLAAVAPVALPLAFAPWVPQLYEFDVSDLLEVEYGVRVSLYDAVDGREVAGVGLRVAAAHQVAQLVERVQPLPEATVEGAGVRRIQGDLVGDAAGQVLERRVDTGTGGGERQKNNVSHVCQ